MKERHPSRRRRGVFRWNKEQSGGKLIGIVAAETKASRSTGNGSPIAVAIDSISGPAPSPASAVRPKRRSDRAAVREIASSGEQAPGGARRGVRRLASMKSVNGTREVETEVRRGWSAECRACRRAPACRRIGST
ncbi:hypothetical protein HAX54_014879 [Datura stramonium]|uniref:Uncharacterized protein n=1 Tax=Datura stramonium TaxID=4076 RepID=A0ABS8TQH7_DATST|nr:hypothetical protein [Datura stramonium]